MRLIYYSGGMFHPLANFQREGGRSDALPCSTPYLFPCAREAYSKSTAVSVVDVVDPNALTFVSNRFLTAFVRVLLPLILLVARARLAPARAHARCFTHRPFLVFCLAMKSAT